MNLLLIFLLTFLVRIGSVMLGGGKNILLPFLILMGLPSNEALASFKFGGISSAFTLIKFHKHHQIKWKLGMYLMLFVAIGSALGSLLVLKTPPELLKKIISVSIVISLVMFWGRQKAKFRKQEIKIKNNFLIYLVSIGAGFLSAWTGLKGVILQYVYMSMGLNYKEALATKKLASFPGSIISVICFSCSGLVHWPVAATMFVAGGLGSWLGAYLGLKIENIILERIFIVITLIMVIKMFW